MGGNYLGNAGVFLIQTLFGLYITAFMLRFLFQWLRADFYNPFSQFLVKVTNPLLVPARKVIPGLFGLDFAALVVIVALQFLELFLVANLFGQGYPLLSLLVLAVAEILKLIIYIFIFAIIIQAVMSWINPGSYNPISSLLHSLTEPLLRPARRLIPPMGGLDLSPLLVLVLLQLAIMLLVHPLADLASRLLQ